jgi:hypothetical protein
MKSIKIAKRFCGPPNSANGGYFAGCVSNLWTQTLTVRLFKPPPLETELQVAELPEGLIELRQGEELIAQGRPAELDLIPPPPPAYLEAVEASRHYYGFNEHPFPTCFVCGPARPRGAGLRIFAGPVVQRAVTQQRIFAAPWVADAFLDRGDGKVKPEFMTAALDCPGYAAVTTGQLMLLGEITAHVDRCVHIDEPCTVIAWRIGSKGRRHVAGTAVFDEDGELCARARAVWIEPTNPERFTQPPA